MSSFLIEEFTTYKVFLYGRKVKGEQTDQAIYINIPSGKAHFYFCSNYMKDNYVEDKNGKKHFHVFLRAEKYAHWIDLFRNESPLFFFYDYDRDLCYITTSDEPVGEGELKSIAAQV
jgi:hypothetical protein